MATNHTPITLGAAGDSAVVNAPLLELDAAIGDLSTINASTPPASVAAAIGDLSTVGITGGTKSSVQAMLGSTLLRTPVTSRIIPAINSVYDLVVAAQTEIDTATTPYASLDERLDAIAFGYVGGNIATLTNGTAAAGQKDVTVDSTTGFIVGGHVAYQLVGGALEYNLIASITPTTVLTMTTNIGTGGIGDDVYIGLISINEYLAAQAIPHAGELTLPETIEYANAQRYNVRALGASPSSSAAVNTAAIQAALNAAMVTNGEVFIPAGTYEINALAVAWGEDVRSPITIRGVGSHDNYSSVTANTNLTILKLSSTTDDAITFTAGSGAQPHITLENIQIWGPGKASASGNGITIDNSVGGGTCYVIMQDVAVIGFGGGSGIELQNVYGCDLGNVSASQNDIGLLIDASSNTNRFSTIHLTDNVTYGLKVMGGSGGNVFTNIVAQGNDGTAIYLTDTGNNLFLGGYTEGNGTLGLHMEGTSGKYVVDNTFINWSFNSAGTTDRVLLEGVSGGTVSDITFIGCTSYVAYAEAFKIGNVYVGAVNLINSFPTNNALVADADMLRHTGRYFTSSIAAAFIGLRNDGAGGGDWRINFHGTGGSYAGGLYFKDMTANKNPLIIAANALDSALYIGASGPQIGANGNAFKLLRHGTAQLSSGAATVTCAEVSADSHIYVTGTVDGGTPGWLRVSARSAGANFTITSSSGTDTSTVSWLMIEP